MKRLINRLRKKWIELLCLNKENEASRHVLKAYPEESFSLLPVLFAEINIFDINLRIKQVQSILINKGYLEDNKATGKFDDDTLNAVRLFQKDNNLVPDGIVSNLTWAALLYPTLSKHVEENGELEQCVRDLQNRLLEMEFPYIKINGRFDFLTEQAVKQFQRMYGLEVDGVVGPMTMSVLLGQKYRPDPQFKNLYSLFQDALIQEQLISTLVIALGILASPFKAKLTVWQVIARSCALACLAPHISKHLSSKLPSSRLANISPYFTTGFISPYLFKALEEWVINLLPISIQP